MWNYGNIENPLNNTFYADTHNGISAPNFPELISRWSDTQYDPPLELNFMGLRHSNYNFHQQPNLPPSYQHMRYDFVVDQKTTVEKVVLDAASISPYFIRL